MIYPEPNEIIQPFQQYLEKTVKQHRKMMILMYITNWIVVKWLFMIGIMLMVWLSFLNTEHSVFVNWFMIEFVFCISLIIIMNVHTYKNTYNDVFHIDGSFCAYYNKTPEMYNTRLRTQITRENAQNLSKMIIWNKILLYKLLIKFAIIEIIFLTTPIIYIISVLF